MPPDERTVARIQGVLAVAGACRTGVGLGELWTLLPEGGPATVGELATFLADRPELATLADGMAFAPGVPPVSQRLRELRGARFREIAEEIALPRLAWLRPWLESLAVTGSAAFGRPDEGDDLDFLAVTRPGALWAFLAGAYLTARLRAVPADGGRPVPFCFNLVLDSREAKDDFARPEGFLFAREALQARPVLGAAAYRGLLVRAGWMREEIPRQFDEATRGGTSEIAPSRPSWGVTALSAFIFPWLAAYLQLRGFQRNAAFRRRGNGGTFRVETRWRKMSLASDRYETLRSLAERTERRAPGPFPTAAHRPEERPRTAPGAPGLPGRGAPRR